MVAFIVLVVCAIVLFIEYLIAKEFYSIAQMKGFNETRYFVYPFLLGIPGKLVVIALPDKRQVVQTQAPATAPASAPEKLTEALPKL